MVRVAETRATIAFGRLAVLPHRRELRIDDCPIELGSRAFDVLMALIDARGSVVSKDALMDRVWPGRIVEENSLQSQISMLRKAFGTERGLIRTVAGRGYQFIGEPSAREAAVDAPKVPAAATGTTAPIRPPTNLSEPLSELIGRESELAEVAALLGDNRLVTLTGAGGIGKTRIALAAARVLLPTFPDGVWVAELGPLSDPDFVATTVANALNLKLDAEATTAEHIAEAVSSKRVMLVLDNCEHVIVPAARMAEALMRANSAIRVVATSREPLRAEGERIYNLPPLSVPAVGAEDPEEVLRTGAVRLFLARMLAQERYFVRDERLTRGMATICRRLDGIPLAIELAAARASTLGIEGLAARLDDRFSLLTGGRRTALPRHQMLRATLDWSYELLSEPERAVLRRLAAFAGGFSLEGAVALAVGGPISASDVVDTLADLVAKSLVGAEVDRSALPYRLLETTRAYALEKLSESGEFAKVARRRAEFLRDLLLRAEIELETRSAADWVNAYGRSIDDVRLALDWAFSPAGDANLGVDLTVASVPLWVQRESMDECRRCVERALGSLEAGSTDASLRAMKLNSALGLSLTFAKGHVHRAGDAWTAALEIAERLGDAEYQLRALWGLWAYRLSVGECRAALGLARRFGRIAMCNADGVNQAIGDRMMGFSLYYLGDHAAAQWHMERMLAGYPARSGPSHINRFHYDQRSTAKAILARILWLQGFADQSMVAARSAVEDAGSIDHAISHCYVLAAAMCPLAILVGDLASAERAVAMLHDVAADRMLGVWPTWGRCWNAVMLMQRGDTASGLRALEASLPQLRETRFALSCTAFLGAMAEGLGNTGKAAQGLALVDEALERSQRNEELWYVAELLRLKGELVLAEDDGKHSAAAEEHFLQALDWASRQGALSWELRAAMSLAKLRCKQAKPKEALALLAGVYGRFKEGFQTADLRAAKALVEALS
ncbi:MAG: winged helix-turn-helix domain-containing protein [Proteobacteria bacterium]|nr:winged helix-turn-helix domain-containing protein [Pseudomonadota bacterium]MBI3495950.1 winged helix-turn-helix domain-containing protein [Pseudomonadota bacterium]